MQTQKMEVGDFSNANMKLSSPAVMKIFEVASRRSWTYLPLPKPYMCGVRLIAPTPTSLRRENILSLVESVRQRRPTVRKLSRL